MVSKSILIHIPKLSNNYLFGIMKIYENLPSSFSLKVIFPKILEEKDFKKLKKKHRRRNFLLAKKNNDLITYTKNILINKIFAGHGKSYEKKKWEYIDKYFFNTHLENVKNTLQNLKQNQSILLNENFVIHCISEINNEQNLLGIINPDLFIMIGGPFIKPEIINNFKVAINVHLGILPYYRGSKTIEWSIIKKDFENIGATIHYMNEQIDAGRIIKKLYYKEPIKKHIGHVHAKLFEISFKHLPKLVINLLQEKTSIKQQPTLKKVNNKNYYFGYMLNELHNKSLIKDCSV